MLYTSCTALYGQHPIPLTLKANKDYNLLRKASHYSSKYYHDLGEGPFSNNDEMLRLRFSKDRNLFSFLDYQYSSGRCLDTLQQHIMCSADTGLLGAFWVQGYGEFVDFNTNHKCKNFDDIRQWAEDHQFWPTSNDRTELRPGDIVLPEIP
jgi:hypothetical protein